MLQPRTIEIVKSTVPVLAEHGPQITARFYQLMFSNHPELLNVFNHANQRQGKQSMALANAVYAAAANIDRLETILPVVQQIAQKHRALNVKPEHYPIVGEHLLLAIKDVLGDAATDDIIQAWAEAYGVIADVFIQVEADMYKEAEQQDGGWSDVRRFIIARKVKESDVITSFYLKPENDQPIASFLPGQYITIRVQPEGQVNTHYRHYSLSQAPHPDVYRISVKREGGDANSPAGVVSCYMHDMVQEGDVIEATAPAGDFTLKPSAAPVVLIGGGVGQTPLLSMLHSLADEDSKRDVYYIHASRNHAAHAFSQEVNELAAQHSHLHTFLCYEKSSGTESTESCDHIGFVDAQWLSSIIPSSVWKKADVYFCGPEPFMKAVYRAIKQLGASPDHIHYEYFGPAGSLEA
ncbi:NO-inducible flavohemoprotein [Paenibacillus alvei]|uniref:Flavohemoprotein n=1 Tax=Paenibacillus alvei TaxID=44250 RepID=A0ABT4H5J4_PAEAL|nr:NO-inducible flavohemoprotein [Paenibacillus alvei]MCY9764257.1 NO-inducible flavohemoprotein [Paenibacillus alvei]MCY9770928.1 NO-inducible flavohemoprotein [Paenibacillus alvei]